MMTDLQQLIANHSEIGAIESAWVAKRNRDNQRRLLGQICSVQAQSGIDSAVVAERLGISEDDLASVVRGETDMTMTELRLLSIACEVVVSYEVASSHSDRAAARSARDEYVQKFLVHFENTPWTEMPRPSRNLVAKWS